MHNHEIANAKPSARRGAIMLVAIVCLALVVLLLGALLRLTTTQRRQVLFEQMRLQADWLAEAAVERAAYRLQMEPGYTGETWKFSPSKLGDDGAGEATIHVSSVDEIPNVRQVRVQAKYPVRTHRFSSRTKQVLVRIPHNHPPDS